MGGILLTGTISIGLMLVLGQYFYPDNIVMWLASADPGTVFWRQVIVASLLALAVAREYFDNILLRVITMAVGIGLIFGGIQFGLNHGDLILDAMLMLSAGTCFAIAGLQPAAEPINQPGWVRGMTPALLLSKLERRLLPHEQLAHLQHIVNIRDDSHHLTLHSR